MAHTGKTIMIDNFNDSILNTNLSKSVFDRGESYIEAAQLIINNASIESAQKDEARAYLEAVQKVWSQKENSPLKVDDLAALQRLLINHVNKSVYNDKSKWKKVKDELDNAENHVNWQRREVVQSVVGNSDNLILRTETPIAKFTLELALEWKSITSSHVEDRPQWFNQLAKWEQNYLRKRIQLWAFDTTLPKPNLGDFLGPLPTTIRRYPGAPNAYHTQAIITGPKGEFTFDKVRFGVLSPVKLKAKSTAQKERKVDSTRQNLEQMIAEAIKIKLASVKEGKGSLNMPILLQTLFSPPFQPPGNYNNKALQSAVDQMREILKDKDRLNAFLKNNEIDNKGYDLKIDLLYTNRPVNKGRGISERYTKDKTMGSENESAVLSLRTLVGNQIIKHPEPTDSLKLAQAALKQYVDMNNEISRLAAIGMIIKNPPYNPVAERAALEQIIINQAGGIRIGSCVSGKDREEMITEIALAQMQFYAKYGEIPPAFDPKDPDNTKRNEFEGMVAHLYLKGHGQKLAGENAKGCDGLKNVEDVFGTRICSKIRELAPQYNIPNEFDPVKDVQKVAGLNKLGTNKLGKITGKDVFVNLIKAVAPLVKLLIKSHKINSKVSKLDKQIEVEKSKDVRRPPFTNKFSYSKQNEAEVQRQIRQVEERKKAVQTFQNSFKDEIAKCKESINKIISKDPNYKGKLIYFIKELDSKASKNEVDTLYKSIESELKSDEKQAITNLIDALGKPKERQSQRI